MIFSSVAEPSFCVQILSHSSGDIHFRWSIGEKYWSLNILKNACGHVKIFQKPKLLFLQIFLFLVNKSFFFLPLPLLLHFKGRTRFKKNIFWEIYFYSFSNILPSKIPSLLHLKKAVFTFHNFKSPFRFGHNQSPLFLLLYYSILKHIQKNIQWMNLQSKMVEYYMQHKNIFANAFR